MPVHISVPNYAGIIKLTIFFLADLCSYHYEERKRKLAEEEKARETAQQQYWPEQARPISYTQQENPLPQLQQSYVQTGHEEMYMYYQPRDIIINDANPVMGGAFYGNETMPGPMANDSDPYLSSVPSDLELGFDGRELNDLMANFGAPDAENTDLLRDNSFSDGLKDDDLSVVTYGGAANDHEWVDVQAYLDSEGFSTTSS
ncbi:unnamed protein product [Gongylonema pulchrum]|uniref:LID domain-containing protein n=1 Tax=Gongylonema pulchrum TaxID=637853 RepID=A0A183DBV6_9BILA|nr:unnamed protein product [Gongylonema pulchrum]